MFRKVLIAGIAVATLGSASAFAATEFYVVKSAATKKCEVVNKKPDGTKLMMIGTAGYKSKKLAEEALKVAADCK